MLVRSNKICIFVEKSFLKLYLEQNVTSETCDNVLVEMDKRGSKEVKEGAGEMAPS